jgi:hypothetical protein
MTKNKDENLTYLLAAAKDVVMTDSDREQQRRSFAYGNTKIENDHITKETIERAAEALKNGR